MTVAALYVQAGGKDSAPRIGTPAKFRNVLLAMARSATIGDTLT